MAADLDRHRPARAERRRALDPHPIRDPSDRPRQRPVRRISVRRALQLHRCILGEQLRRLSPAEQLIEINRAVERLTGDQQALWRSLRKEIGDAGVLIVESAAHAEARGARIRAEIAGFAANSDDFDLVLPEPSGARAAQCMELALADAAARPEEVDAVNAHATATPAGDLAEAEALRRVFTRLPPVASSKSLGGHALGASGVHEAIHCILQLEGGFLAPSINSQPRDPALLDLPVVTETRPATPRLMLSNSFGFGGTHAVLAIRAS